MSNPIFHCSSNVQLGLDTSFDPFPTLIVIQSRLHPLLDKLFNLLRCPTHKTLRVQEGGKVPFYRVEVRISLDPFDEIVLETELFDLMSGFMR